ncbi:F-box/kelch-repeat protein, partial [Dorcoceras hygrometricum]
FDGESLSCVEIYICDPDTDNLTVIESIRWGYFASGFKGKLYVMGGRSSFTIGCQIKNKRLHAVPCVAWNGKRA